MEKLNLGWCTVIIASEIDLRDGETYDGNPTALRAMIALRESGDEWELAWSRGGDWCGIASDDLTDIESIGGLCCGTADEMDAARPQALRRGAGQLRIWSTEIGRLNCKENNHALTSLVDYLRDRAGDAETATTDEVSP